MEQGAADATGNSQPDTLGAYDLNGAPTDKSYNALDVIPAFSKDHDSQRYTTDWHNVSAFAQNPVFQNFEAAMSSPDPNVVEQAKTLIDNKYGKGFHRYFTGSAQ